MYIQKTKILISFQLKNIFTYFSLFCCVTISHFYECSKIKDNFLDMVLSSNPDYKTMYVEGYSMFFIVNLLKFASALLQSHGINWLRGKININRLFLFYLFHISDFFFHLYIWDFIRQRRDFISIRMDYVIALIFSPLRPKTYKVIWKALPYCKKHITFFVFSFKSYGNKDWFKK